MGEGQRITTKSLDTDQPTEVQFGDLQEWVIWQFPRLKRGWLCGAVHPPLAECGWFPASIQPNQQRLLIHAHRVDPFVTPEEAAEWLAEQP